MDGVLSLPVVSSAALFGDELHLVSLTALRQPREKKCARYSNGAGNVRFRGVNERCREVSCFGDASVAGYASSF